MDYASGTGDILLAVRGGGYTEFRSIHGSTSYKSFNNSEQRDTSVWIPLNSQLLRSILATGQGDLDLLFCSPELLGSLEGSFSSASKVTSSVGTDSYRLILTGPPNSPARLAATTVAMNDKGSLARVLFKLPLNSKSAGSLGNIPAEIPDEVISVGFQ